MTTNCKLAVTLNEISSRLTTKDLADWNQAVDLEGRSPAAVAQTWLEEHPMD